MANRRRVDIWVQHRVHRSADGIEFYNYPTALAQKYFYHVRSMGQAKLTPGYRFKPEPRAGFLLHYTRRGETWYAVRGGKPQRSPAGSVCLMDFSDDNEHGNAGPGVAQIWWVHFDGRDIPHLFTELRTDRDPIFALPDPKRFESLFLELMALTQGQTPSYDARSFATLAAMIAELFTARITREQMVGLVGRKVVLSQSVRNGIDYMIRFHADTGLGLKRICEAANLSMRHFMRVFRAEIGITPIQYLNRYRVERAKQLLRSSDKPIEQIAALVGASNQSYFSYLFRRRTGKTPREYRAQALPHQRARN